MIFVFLVDWLKTVKKNNIFICWEWKLLVKTKNWNCPFIWLTPIKNAKLLSLISLIWPLAPHNHLSSSLRFISPRKTLLGYFYFSWETNHFLWDVSTMTEITHIFHDLMYQYHWSTMDHPHHSTGSHCTRGKFRGLNVEKILTS